MGSLPLPCGVKYNRNNGAPKLTLLAYTILTKGSIILHKMTPTARSSLFKKAGDAVSVAYIVTKKSVCTPQIL
jgi:hypothetical protein